MFKRLSIRSRSTSRRTLRAPVASLCDICMKHTAAHDCVMCFAKVCIEDSIACPPELQTPGDICRTCYYLQMGCRPPRRTSVASTDEMTVEGSRRTGDSIEGTCAVCKAPVSRDSADSTSLDVDGGVYYCAEHRNNLPKDCGNCRFAVTGQAVRALGRLWHEECFCCSVCEARIDDDQFYVQGGHFFCAKHADADLFNQFIVRASRSIRSGGHGMDLSDFDNDDLDEDSHTEGNSVFKAHRAEKVYVESDAPMSPTASESKSMVEEEDDESVDTPASTRFTPVMALSHAIEAMYAPLKDDNRRPSTQKSRSKRGSSIGAPKQTTAFSNQHVNSSELDEWRIERDKNAVGQNMLGMTDGDVTMLHRALEESTTKLPPEAFTQHCQFTFKVNRRTFHFEEYAWAPFDNLRHRFGIDRAQFVESMCANPIEGGSEGGGKSGMTFWWSHDQRLIIKTIKPEEVAVFLRMFSSYYAHIMYNAEHTLLSRFYGIYTIKFPGRAAVRFLVINNVMYIPPEMRSAVHIAERYDLKGSVMKRYVGLTSSNATLKDLDFCDKHEGTTNSGEVFMAREGECRKFHIGTLAGHLLLVNLRADAKWLEERKIMDYSLLVGIGCFDRSQLPPDTIRESMDAQVEAFQSGGDHPVPNSWNRFLGGVQGHGLHDSLVYYLGIIDILQEFNMKKWVESAYKSKLQSARGLDPEGMSAIHQSTYSKRFIDFFEQHVDIGAPVMGNDHNRDEHRHKETKDEFEEPVAGNSKSEEEGSEELAKSL